MEPHLDKTRGEFGLNIDLDVLLWEESRVYYQQVPIKSYRDFLIMDNCLMEEFDTFKKNNIPLGSSVIKCNTLLNLWILTQHNICQYSLFGADHVTLTQEQVDNLCEWVIDLRERVTQGGTKVLEELTQHLHSVNMQLLKLYELSPCACTSHRVSQTSKHQHQVTLIQYVENYYNSHSN